MAIIFTLYYRYPEWCSDGHEEDKYIESLIELASRIQKAAETDLDEKNVFYNVVCLNPGTNASYCSSNSPHLMVIADVPDGEEELVNFAVPDFQKTCLAFMKDFAKNGEEILSWWRCFQSYPSAHF